MVEKAGNDGKAEGAFDGTSTLSLILCVQMSDILSSLL